MNDPINSMGGAPLTMSSRSPMIRRDFLRFIPVAAVAVSIPACVAETAGAKSEFDLGQFLATAGPAEVAHYHASELTKAMDKISPYKAFRYKIDEDNGVVIVFGDRISASAAVDH